MPFRRFLIGAFALWGPAAIILAQDQKPPAPPPPQPAPPAPPIGVTVEKPAPAAAAPVTPLAHVEVRGTGPVPMVLIPNLVMDWTIFESFMARNGARYTMYAVTLPGFANSSPPPVPPQGTSYGAATWVTNAERAVMQMIREKKLERPVVLGQSLGGHVALRLAIGYPTALRAVVVVNSMSAVPLDGDPRSREDRARQVDDDIAAAVRTMPEEAWKANQAAWITGSLADPGRAKALVEKAAGVPQAVSSRYMLEYFGADLTEAVPKIEIPLLVIAPAGPVLNPHWGAMRERWKSQYGPARRGTLVFFEDSGEFITEDSPAELDRAIEQFLADKPVSGKTALPGIPPPSRPAPPAAPSEEAPKPAPPKPADPKPPEPKPSEPK